MSRHSSGIYAMYFDGIEQSAHTEAVEAYLPNDACFSDLDYCRLVGLGDFGDYEVLFLLSHPLFRISSYAHYQRFFFGSGYIRPSFAPAMRDYQCAMQALYTHR